MNKKPKKLALSSETLRHLDEMALKDAQGAATAGTGMCSECTIACTMCTLRCGGSVCCP